MADEKKDYLELIEQGIQKGDYSTTDYDRQRENVVSDMESRAAETQRTNAAAQNASVKYSNTNVTDDIRKFFYDASGDAAYQQALQALQQAQQNKPSYAGTYDKPLLDIYNEIVNRDKFKYDLNSDMLYQQYKDQYTALGQMAMRDSMGQAAALTGGYGSSYGQSVGQQQYDAYLQQLNDVVPELYGMAVDQYNAEGDRMLQQYNMMAGLRDDEYGRYQDALNQYWTNVQYAQNQADSAYDRSYDNWLNAYQMQQQKEQEEYNRQQEEYDRLANLISTTGYEPTWQECFFVNMSPQQAQAYRNQYLQNQQAATKSYSSGGNGSSTKSASNASTTTGLNPDYSRAPSSLPKNYDVEVQILKRKGASDGEIIMFLSEGVRSGDITQAKANELEKKYTRGWI